jgi:S-adenosylmethionine synthetase
MSQPAKKPMSHPFCFSSESVSEGHPDKVSDFIADSIVDAYLAQDLEAEIACEVMCKGSRVVLGGEIASPAEVDVEAVTRAAIREAGYTRSDEVFHADGVEILNFLQIQERKKGSADLLERTACDQGLVFGFATKETPELLPLSLVLAHSINLRLAWERKRGRFAWLRPDGKSQVTLRYRDGLPCAVETVVVSAHHVVQVELEEVRETIASCVLPEVLGDWWNAEIQLLINPAGEFVTGGPEGDCGMTGRKSIIDTYGGWAAHGGGALSGKDPGKTDRCTAYFARKVAREIVLRGLAECVEIQLAYAIGVARPVSLRVDTRGTGDPVRALQYAKRFDYRPGAIIEQLNLLRPIYRSTTNYGHFGKPELPWEN